MNKIRFLWYFSRAMLKIELVRAVFVQYEIIRKAEILRRGKNNEI